MPDLDFQVERVEPERYALAPLLNFKLKIDQSDGASGIHAIALRCQIRVEPGRRHYTEQQKESLLELFGRPAQWGNSLRPMLWTHASAIVPAFAGSTIADLPVPCTFDFNVAATKYFDALGTDGEIPLCFLFSGTVFYENEDGSLQTAPISWSKEAIFRLPLSVWRQMMDLHYPNSAWLCLNKEVFDRLRQYKTQSGQMTLDQAIDDLLESAHEKVSG
ncbi:MAG TPA: DUF6084 family protein [Tepidisphaeraceae bacterium]|jgi:hypothetical protein|nr:DUF6084 family protein [Tepidisphaeraceae bacterium]